jgi:radical SAM superfamily enzyme YgiQ (UPF0313 family)
MVFLINSYITSRERYGKDIGDIGGHQMPLGIYYLAAYLLRDSVKVSVIDAEAFRLAHEEVMDILMKSDVKIIGITSTTVGFRNARALAEMIRRALPYVTIIIGGPHMTAMPDATMKTGAFDYGIIREGEIALSRLVQFLLYGKGRIEEIPNIYYTEAGKIACNPAVEYIQEMDSIPFPARQLCPDISVYKPPVGAFRRQPVVSIITSRGCPYQCIFCDNNTFGRKTRFFSAEYVVAEIEEVVKKYGAKEIAFLDDTFVLDKRRLRRIFELLKERGIEFAWSCMTRVNNLDYETLKFMKENGCWQIRFGIESGNQEVLDFIKKGITLQQVRDVAEWCRRLKINTTGFFMIGHHTDTLKTIQDTIEFANSLPLTDVTAAINTPIPGTESYAKAKQYGTYDESDWTSLNYWTPVFVPHGLSREVMLEKQAELYRRFYLRLDVIIRQLLKIRTMEMFTMAVRNAVLGWRYVRRSKGK